MKALLFPLLLVTATGSFGQQVETTLPVKEKVPRSELSVSYSFGFSNRLLQQPGTGPFTHLDHTDARSYYDQGYTLKYNYTVFQHANNRLLVGAGVGLFNSRHYQPIIDKQDDYNLANVVFDSRTVSVPVSISYERAFFNNRFFLELGLTNGMNIPLKKESIYTGEGFKENFIDYNYQVNVRTNNYMTTMLSLTPKFRIKDQLFLDCSLSYLWGKKLSYDYSYTTVAHMTDLTTGQDYVNAWAVRGLPDTEVKDNYLYLSVGLSYRF